MLAGEGQLHSGAFGSRRSSSLRSNSQQSLDGVIAVGVQSACGTTAGTCTRMPFRMVEDERTLNLVPSFACSFSLALSLFYLRLIF